MSNLFLDTEIDEKTFRYIAKVVTDAKLTPQEAKTILWQELFPILQANLSHPAGVWAGYSKDWLKTNIKMAPNNGAIQGDPNIIKEIKRCWGHVCQFLPPEYA